MATTLPAVRLALVVKVKRPTQQLLLAVTTSAVFNLYLDGSVHAINENIMISGVLWVLAHDSGEPIMEGFQ
ncbi:MAG: hypothetical protein R3C11_11250 [Planctomycetaceae bacterium]